MSPWPQLEALHGDETVVIQGGEGIRLWDPIIIKLFYSKAHSLAFNIMSLKESEEKYFLFALRHRNGDVPKQFKQCMDLTSLPMPHTHPQKQCVGCGLGIPRECICGV